MVFQKMRNNMKAVLIVVVVAFIGGLLYLGGLNWYNPQTAAQVSPAIATVNGEDIGYDAFQQAYMNVVKRQQMTGQQITGSMIESLRYSALDQLIANKLLLQEAEEQDIKVSREQIDERLEEIKSQFDSEEDYTAQLQAAGITEADLREMLRNELRITNLHDKVVAGLEVTDEEVAEAYREVEASHILLKPENDSAEAWKKARAEAEEVLSEYESGTEFAELAREYSDDEFTAENGGALGKIRASSTVVDEALKKAALELQVGEVSDPIKTESGYHILTVTSRKDPSGEEFEEAKEDLREELLAEKEADKFRTWYQDLRSEAEIVINDPQLKAHRLLVEGELEAALAAYEEAIEANPENGYLYKTVSDIYRQQDNMDKALEYLKTAAEKLETDATVFYQLGKLYLDMGKQDEAVEAFKQASKFSPNNYMMHAMLANEYQELGLDELFEEENAKFQEIIQRLQEQRKRMEEAMKKQAEEQAQEDAGAETEDADAADTNSGDAEGE